VKLDPAAFLDIVLEPALSLDDSRLIPEDPVSEPLVRGIFAAGFLLTAGVPLDRWAVLDCNPRVSVENAIDKDTFWGWKSLAMGTVGAMKIGMYLYGDVHHVRLPFLLTSSTEG